jgi:hypothetical protein
LMILYPLFSAVMTDGTAPIWHVYRSAFCGFIG